jgi:small GTP-binding protein
MNAKYNAVIIGQTGVGKSSLINYLYGQKIAETGVGKPVTKNGFHQYDFEINGLPVCLFDSWGLEVGKDEQWMNDLNQEFQKRGVIESADKWFHSAFYCISASGARIQDFDIKIIKRFIEENYKISVVLTKCDQVSVEGEEALKKELLSQIKELSIISVCSEETKTRVGTSEPFGKEYIERQAFSDFFDSLILRLPLRCKSIMQAEINDWSKECVRLVEKDNIWLTLNIGDKTLEQGIVNSATGLNKKLTELMQEETERTFKMYGSFSAKLGYPHQFDNCSESENIIFGKKSSSKGFYDGLGFFGIIGMSLFTAVIAVPVIAFSLYNYKDDFESWSAYIHDCAVKLEESIENQVNDLTKKLESLKERASEQKLLN